MIIIHAITQYYPVIGRIERAVQRIAEEQARLGHEVHVVTSTYGTEKRLKEEVMNNVYIHRLKTLRLYYPDLTVMREVPEDHS